MLLFSRLINLTIAESKSATGKLYSTSKSIDSSTGFGGFDIAFEIKKTTEPVPDNSTIQIFNLNKDSRGSLEKQKLVVRLDAGYDGIAKRIFTGRVIEGGVSHTLKGSNWITTFIVKDGGYEFVDTKVSKSFKNATTAEQVIDYLITELGLSKGLVKDIPVFRYNQGISLSGYARKQLSIVCNKVGLQWFIADDEINIIPKSGLVSTTAPLVSADTGMIEAPVKKDKGFEVKTLLNPDIKVGRPVEIKSQVLNGTYKVSALKMIGESNGADFFTVVSIDE